MSFVQKKYKHYLELHVQTISKSFGKCMSAIVRAHHTNKLGVLYRGNVAVHLVNKSFPQWHIFNNTTIKHLRQYVCCVFAFSICIHI